MQKNFGRAVAGGIAGTAVMTMVMLMAPLMGMPEMNIARMLADFMGFPVALGWTAHFMIGTFLAVTYAYIFGPRLPGGAIVRGAIFGFIPWFVMQIMVNPIMGAGLFALNTPAPMLVLGGSLMGHIIYGAVVGAVYGGKALGVNKEGAVQH